MSENHPDQVHFPDGNELVEVGGRQCVESTTTGVESSYRSISANVIEEPGAYQIETWVRTSRCPAKEQNNILVLGGVVLSVDDQELHWQSRDRGGLEWDVSAGTEWTPETWHHLKVEGEWSEEDGHLTLELDGALVGELDKARTWGLDQPRAWIVAALNVRDEIAVGPFTIWHTPIKVYTFETQNERLAADLERRLRGEPLPGAPTGPSLPWSV